MADSKKFLAVTAGVAGAAGLAVLATNANPVAASTGTVNYQSGATTVWSSPSWTQVKKYVLYGDQVQLLSQKTDNNGAVWYEVGAGQWIPKIYLNIDGQTATVEAPTQTQTATQQPAATPSQQPAADNSVQTTPSTPAANDATAASSSQPAQSTPAASSTASSATSDQSVAPAQSEETTSSTPVASQPETPSTPVAEAPVELPATGTSVNVQVHPKVQDVAVTQWAATSFASQPVGYLTAGQTATAVAKVEVQGTTWYQLENAAYVPSTYVAEGAAPAVSQPSTPSVTPETPSQPETPSVSQPSTPSNTQPEAPSTSNPSTSNPSTSNPSTPSVTQPEAPSTPAPSTPSGDRDQKIQAVINIARQQIGKPYVWGGKGPNSFDCSGLMYYAFLNGAGVNVGGWTVPQESSGARVSLSALQPGDLLFWGAAGNSYHVALYIGGGQYIQAPQPGENVKITSMTYWAPDFAVRPSL